MSTYIKKTKHPELKKFMDALWIDDYFGNHNYGVQFAGEETIYDMRENDFKTNDREVTTPWENFEFMSDASPEEDGWETVFDDVIIDLIKDVTSQHYILIKLVPTGTDITLYCKDMAELASLINDDDECIAYDFVEHVWFIPKLTVEQKIIK